MGGAGDVADGEDATTERERPCFDLLLNQRVAEVFHPTGSLAEGDLSQLSKAFL